MGTRQLPATLRWTLGGAVAVVVVVAVLITRVALSAGDALKAGQEALARGQVTVAIDAFERAARMRAPGVRTAERALHELERLAATAGRAGDRAVARRALEAARRAILGSRALGAHQEARLQRINRHLARLLATAEGTDSQERRAWHAARLARDHAPAARYSLLAIVGFGLWVGGGAALALRGVGPDDRLRRRQALIAGAAVVGGLVLWALGLWLA